MKKLTRKITLFIGAPLVLMTPIITAVSCEKFEQSDTGKFYEQTLDNEIKKYEGLGFTVPEGTSQIRVARNEEISGDFFTPDRIPGITGPKPIPTDVNEDVQRTFSFKYESDGTMIVTVTLSMPFTQPRTATFEVTGFKSDAEAAYEEYIYKLETTAFAGAGTEDAPQIGAIDFKTLNDSITSGGVRLPKPPRGITTEYDVLERGRDNSWINLHISVFEGNFESPVDRNIHQPKDEVTVRINNFKSNLLPKVEQIFDYFKTFPSYVWLMANGIDWINNNINPYLNLAKTYGENAITYMLNTIFPYSNGNIGWIEIFDPNQPTMTMADFDHNEKSGEIHLQNLNNLGMPNSNVVTYNNISYSSLPAGMDAMKNGILGEDDYDLIPISEVEAKFASFGGVQPDENHMMTERYTLGNGRGGNEAYKFSISGQWNKNVIAMWLWEIMNDFAKADAWAKTQPNATDGMIISPDSTVLTTSPDYYISGDFYDYYDYLIATNKIVNQESPATS